MANIIEQQRYEAVVYELATTDPVMGGTGGVDNLPHLQLTNRTAWLKQQVDALIAAGGSAAATTAAITAAINAHLAAVDPHAQYTTNAEVQVLIDGRALLRANMPQGLQRVATRLPDDYALQTWSDALEDGRYDVFLTVAQNGLSAGWWYIDVQRHSGDVASNSWRTITAKSLGVNGNTRNQIYTSTCANGFWTPFRRVAVDEPLTWITPTFVNGWVDYGLGWNCQYAKDSIGTVFIKGLVKSGSNTLVTVIFTLPVGMRPSTDLMYSGATSGGSGRLDVYSDGNVLFYGTEPHTGNATIWLSIAATFKAEQ